MEKITEKNQPFKKTQLKWILTIYLSQVRTGIHKDHIINYEKMQELSTIQRLKYQIHKGIGLKNDFAKICGFKQSGGSFDSFFENLKEKGYVIPYELNGRNGFYKFDKKKVFEKITKEDDFLLLFEKVMDDYYDLGFKF